MAAGTKAVACDRHPDERIARLTFHNPGRGNAIDLEMAAALRGHLEALAIDDEVSVVLLRGAGGTFTTGADMAVVYDWYATPGDTRRPSQRRRLAVDRAGQTVYHLFAGFPKVTVVQAERYALGAGFELALMADIAVVGTSAVVGMPATKLLGPILGNLPVFFHRLGPMLAREMLLTGDTKTGAEIDRHNVFTRVVEDADVAVVAEQFASKIARMPADGIHLAKEAYRLVESQMALGSEEMLAYLFHTLGTNLRFEPGEYNFVKVRSEVGTSRALDLRDEHFGAPVPES